MTVDELVEQWRVQLGLLPWDERAAGARLGAELSHDPDPLRRSGRTTRGILEALARCVLENKPKLYIDPRCKHTLREHCYRVAEKLAHERLGLGTWLRYGPWVRPSADGIIYTDHAV